jgi:hypothetical protein
MRRPVSVKTVLVFCLFRSVVRISQAASVAILRFALSDMSLGARWRSRFGGCCYLIIDLASSLLAKSGRDVFEISIDFENDRNPNVAGLQKFIDAYPSVLPYDKTGQNHAQAKPPKTSNFPLRALSLQIR